MAAPSITDRVGSSAALRRHCCCCSGAVLLRRVEPKLGEIPSTKPSDVVVEKQQVRSVQPGSDDGLHMCAGGGGWRHVCVCLCVCVPTHQHGHAHTPRTQTPGSFPPLSSSQSFPQGGPLDGQVAAAGREVVHANGQAQAQAQHASAQAKDGKVRRAAAGSEVRGGRGRPIGTVGRGALSQELQDNCAGR